jgi:biotin operon repressor
LSPASVQVQSRGQKPRRASIKQSRSSPQRKGKRITDATTATLVAIIGQQARTVEQQAETISVLVAEISRNHGSDRTRPRWNDPEIVANTKAKIVEWLGDHPEQRPCKSEMARRLNKISNATTWAAISALEAEGVVAVSRTKRGHLLSLIDP